MFLRAMLRSELVRKVAAAHPHLTHRDAEAIVAAVFGAITDALARGDRVEMRGIGSFSVRYKAAREARNPKTGRVVALAEKAVVRFRTGRGMARRLDEWRVAGTPRPARDAQLVRIA